MPIDRKYTGYIDNEPDGYIGIKANIDYTAPESVCNQTNSWVGVDRVADSVWVQIGWAYEVKPAKRIAGYAEVSRADGGYRIVYTSTVVGGVTYKIEKDDDTAVWTIAETTIHEENWADIVGGKVMPRAVYTVEVFEPDCDYIPGSSEARCNYKTIKTKATGGSYANAPLATKNVDDPNGNASKSTNGTTDMAVWDSRAGGDEAMSQHSHDSAAATRAAEPSLAWQPKEPGPSPEQSDALARMPAVSAAGLDTALPDAERVTLSDRHPLGAPPEVAALRVGLRDVPVDPDGTGARVPVDLFVEESSLGPIAAATISVQAWAAPSPDFEPADVTATLAEIGIEPVFDPGIAPKMALEEVFGAIARDMGVPAQLAGHVVLRPRILAPSYPKIRRGGKLVPDRPRGLYWIAEIRGTVIHEVVAPEGTHVGHQTGLVALVDEARGDAFYGIGLA